jgi:Tfp pilus assembly major pilin PilA
MMNKQRGMTLISWIFVLGMIAFFATIVMRLFPMYPEYYAVVDLMEGMETEIKNNPLTKNQTMLLIKKRFNTGYISSVKTENIEIIRGKNNAYVTKIIIDYEVRKHFIGQIDLVGHFVTEADAEAEPEKT